jgi:transcriptional regulator with XRE-family HTH domain
MATFAERLRQLRNEKDITLDELATIFGTTKATLSRYENDLRVPKAEFVKKAAGFFNVSTDYIMGQTDVREQKWWEKEEPPADIELDGIAASIDGHKIIGVNSSLEEPLRRFVIAHELGHFVLHPEGNFFFVLRKTMLYGKLEYQANLFAVALCFGKKIAQHDDIKSVITGQVKDFYSIAKIL